MNEEKKRKQKKETVRWREKILSAIETAGLPPPTLEHHFVESRRFRFDFAWPDLGLAMEFDGATFVGGGHSTGLGHETDARKRNTAQLLGWIILVFGSRQVVSGEMIRVLSRWIHRNEVWIEP